jgi:hypothetical protein
MTLLGLRSRWIGVGGVEGVADGADQAHDLVGCQGAVFVESPVEWLAFEVLHREEDDPVILAQIVGARDVGVGDGVSQRHLPAEPLHVLLVLGDARTQRLDGHQLAQQEVVAERHHPHAARADHAAHQVAAGDQLAWSPGHAAAPRLGLSHHGGPAVAILVALVRHRDIPSGLADDL